MNRPIVAIPVTALLAVTALLGVAACTSSTHGTGARVHSSQPPGAPPLVSSLDGQLLTPADLPGGWTIARTADPAVLPAPPCIETAVSAVQTATKARVQFVRSGGVPLLEQQIGQYATAAQARAKYSAAVAAVDGCHTVTFDYQGVRISGTIGRLQFPALADASTAWHLTLQAIGLLATGDAVLVVKGRELELLVYLALGNTEPREVAPLAMTAAAKLPA